MHRLDAGFLQDQVAAGRNRKLQVVLDVAVHVKKVFGLETLFQREQVLPCPRAGELAAFEGTQQDNLVVDAFVEPFVDELTVLLEERALADDVVRHEQGCQDERIDGLERVHVVNDDGDGVADDSAQELGALAVAKLALIDHHERHGQQRGAADVHHRGLKAQEDRVPAVHGTLGQQVMKMEAVRHQAEAGTDGRTVDGGISQQSHFVAGDQQIEERAFAKFFDDGDHQLVLADRRDAADQPGQQKDQHAADNTGTQCGPLCQLERVHHQEINDEQRERDCCKEIKPEHYLVPKIRSPASPRPGRM